MGYLASSPLERMLNAGTAAAEESGDFPIMAALIWKTSDGAIEYQAVGSLNTEELIGLDHSILPDRVQTAIKKTLEEYFEEGELRDGRSF